MPKSKLTLREAEKLATTKAVQTNCCHEIVLDNGWQVRIVNDWKRERRGSVYAVAQRDGNVVVYSE